MSTQPSAEGTPAVEPSHSPNEAPAVADDNPEALRNLIVNYLPPMMDESQVHQLFYQFGLIDSVKIIYDKETRESRGYGFVRFQFFFSGAYAISYLNRFEIAGKKLKVAYANIEAAKSAYDALRQSLSGFTALQKVALHAMFYQQMLLAQSNNELATEHPSSTSASHTVSPALQPQ